MTWYLHLSKSNNWWQILYKWHIYMNMEHNLKMRPHKNLSFTSYILNIKYVDFNFYFNRLPGKHAQLGSIALFIPITQEVHVIALKQFTQGCEQEAQILNASSKKPI